MTEPQTPLFCIDFDKTIIRGQSNNALVYQHDVYLEVDMEFTTEDRMNFAKFFLKNPQNGLRDAVKIRSIITKALKLGFNIAITSFTNYPEVIKLALEQIDLNPEEIRKIPVIAFFPDDETQGKTEHLKQAMKHFGYKDQGAVMLIDDNRENCQIAKAQGHKTIIADDEGHFLDKILKGLSLLETTQVPTDETESEASIDQADGGGAEASTGQADGGQVVELGETTEEH